MVVELHYFLGKSRMFFLMPYGIVKRFAADLNRVKGCVFN